MILAFLRTFLFLVFAETQHSLYARNSKAAELVITTMPGFCVVLALSKQDKVYYLATTSRLNLRLWQIVYKIFLKAYRKGIQIEYQNSN